MSISGNSLVITGANFFTADFTAKAKYAGVEATSVTIDSANQVTATWTSGVPRFNTAVAPSLWFEGAQATHWAAGTATVANAATVSAIASNVECSFQGGCEITLNQDGLLSSFGSEDTSLRVCGVNAEIKADASTSSTVKFNVPRLATTYSASNFKIAEESYLRGTPFSSSSNPAQALSVFDKNDVVGFSDTT